jgi:hypothetical protein
VLAAEGSLAYHEALGLEVVGSDERSVTEEYLDGDLLEELNVVLNYSEVRLILVIN